MASTHFITSRIFVADRLPFHELLGSKDSSGLNVLTSADVNLHLRYSLHVHFIDDRVNTACLSLRDEKEFHYLLDVRLSSLSLVIPGVMLYPEGNKHI